MAPSEVYLALAEIADLISDAEASLIRDAGRPGMVIYGAECLTQAQEKLTELLIAEEGA